EIVSMPMQLPRATRTSSIGRGPLSSPPASTLESTVISCALRVCAVKRILSTRERLTSSRGLNRCLRANTRARFRIARQLTDERYAYGSYGCDGAIDLPGQLRLPYKR